MKTGELVGRVWSGVPLTLASLLGKLTDLALDTSQSLRVYLSQGLEKGTSSIEGWEKPATGIMHGTFALTGGADQLPANACLSVTVQSRATNVAATGIAVGGPAIPAPPGGGVVLTPGASFTPPGGINNTSLVYVRGTAAEVVDFTYTTR